MCQNDYERFLDATGMPVAKDEEYKLGQRVRSRVSGLTGTVIGIAQYQNEFDSAYFETGAVVRLDLPGRVRMLDGKTVYIEVLVIHKDNFMPLEG